MTEKITASAVVALDGDSDEHYLDVALDDRDDGYNQGQTAWRVRLTNSDTSGPVYLVRSSVPSLTMTGVQGTLSTLSASVLTDHKSQEAVFAQPGQDAEVTLSPPASALPTAVWHYGTATLKAGKRAPNGALQSVILSRVKPSNDDGQWHVVSLTWKSQAQAVKLTPAINASAAWLLVHGKKV
jgi:hypothetical protein